MHTVIDHDGYLPAVVTVTEAKCHEVNIAKLLKLPKGSIVVFDRGYNDYTWFRHLCKSGVFLVTRLKSNAGFGSLSATARIRQRASPPITSSRSQWVKKP